MPGLPRPRQHRAALGSPLGSPVCTRQAATVDSRRKRRKKHPDLDGRLVFAREERRERGGQRPRLKQLWHSFDHLHVLLYRFGTKKSKFRPIISAAGCCKEIQGKLHVQFGSNRQRRFVQPKLRSVQAMDRASRFIADACNGGQKRCKAICCALLAERV